MNDNQSTRDWGEESAAQPPRREIFVVLCEPGKMAKAATIEASLESYQKAVGGYIEAYYPFEEPVCIVCNDEGKLIGLELNRGLRRKFRQPLSRTAPALYGAVQIPGTFLPNGQRDSSGALST